MGEVVFVEDPRDAVSSEIRRTAAHIVSVTAVASEALDRTGISYSPIGRFSDLRSLSAADDDLNRHVFELAASLEDHFSQDIPALRTDGPGFITGHAYY